MNQPPGVPLGAGEPVGARLARMRDERGLSGKALGQLVGMSQAKVSRIETNRGRHDPEDIGRLARALGADDNLVQELVDQAEISLQRSTGWRPFPIGLAGAQRTIGQYEATANTLRAFEPTMVHGLLQTSEYARALLAAFQFQELLDRNNETNAAISLAEAVSARVQRQQILADPTKTFRIVMMEAALSNRFCPVEDMVGQIRRLRKITAEYPNVTIRVVSAQIETAIPPLHGFQLFDDKLVMAELFNAGLTSHVSTDIKLHRRVFDSFDAEADAEIEPVLDKYQSKYARLLVGDDSDAPGA